MFYVDINAEVENQQAVIEGRNKSSYNGNACDVRNPLRIDKMSASKESLPRNSPIMKHRSIKDEVESIKNENNEDEDDVNESLFPRCKSSKYRYRPITFWNKLVKVCLR